MAENDIAAQLEDTFGVAADVYCDDDMHVITGAHYRCTAHTEDGLSAELEIVITDAQSAAYTWEVAS
ncbi:protein of unknown function [Geodermatophilus aquaeductus]|uniref:DUF4333 domain-containing protein n=1 Tax=Geodermatophilus aquaeductus TaxID=1564161 RepID=A0A521EXF3_9ACTN|nr:protein of unknown function [Geodermatophilus aquaeductus]